MRISERLEPTCGMLLEKAKTDEEGQTAALLSAAVSLKRIADTLEKVVTDGTAWDPFCAAIRTYERDKS